MAEENVIELKGVEKTFRDFWMRPVAEAVRGLELEVARGDVFGLELVEAVGAVLQV